MGEGLRQFVFLEVEGEHAQFLDDLVEVVEHQVVGGARLHEGVYQLVNHLQSSRGVAQVGADGALLQFLNQHIYESVEHARRVEEFFKDHLVFVGSLRVDVVVQSQTEILVNGYEILLVLENFELHRGVIHGSNLGVVHFAVCGHCKSSQVVGDAQAFFTSLNAQRFVDFEFVFVVAAEHD